MAEETLKEYALDSADAAYENTGDQSSMVLMDLVREMKLSEIHLPGYTRKFHHSPPPTVTDNTRWETAVVCISMNGEAIRNATGRPNSPLE